MTQQNKNGIVAPEVSCGARPIAAEYTYGISTDDVKRYMQQAIDSAIALNNQRCEEDRKNGKTPTVRPLNPTSIDMKSIVPSEYFAPLLFIAKANDIKRNDRRPRGIKDNEIPVMSEQFLADQNGGDRFVAHPSIYAVLSQFRYNSSKERKKNKNARAAVTPPIESYIESAWQGMKIRKNHMQGLMSLARMKDYKMSSSDMAVLLLDPILVFHAMLRNPDQPNERYSVVIDGFTKLDMSGSKLKYRVRKITKVDQSKDITDPAVMKLVKEQITRASGQRQQRNND